jgi:hypothetical protein
MLPPVKSRSARFGFDGAPRITGAVDGATRDLLPTVRDHPMTALERPPSMPFEFTRSSN